MSKIKRPKAAKKTTKRRKPLRLDPNRYYSTVHGKREPDDPQYRVRFMQNGHAFDAHGFEVKLRKRLSMREIAENLKTIISSGPELTEVETLPIGTNQAPEPVETLTFAITDTGRANARADAVHKMQEDRRKPRGLPAQPTPQPDQVNAEAPDPIATARATELAMRNLTKRVLIQEFMAQLKSAEDFLTRPPMWVITDNQAVAIYEALHDADY